MNFPPFWAKGVSGNFSAWHWSFKSFEEAQALANQAAQQVADAFRADNMPSDHGRGGYYPDRPFREEILQEFKDATGETSAVITRNSYGCTVLNTARIMFVDIDLPEPKAPGLFKRLFGKPDLKPPVNPQNAALSTVENWTRQRPEWGWRVYRTRAGLRLLATQGLVEATSATAKEIFAAFAADPLYQKLCENQNCYRARLTPKPWRCGLWNKPQRWPWLDPQEEKQFRKWEAEYQSCAAKWATCEFLRHIGNRTIHPEVQSILTLHDDTTRAESKLQLA